MNGPFHVAQADTSEAGGGGDKQHPRIVKVTKPYGDQSVVVSLSYDGSVRADLSSIASEKITLVHIGEKLIILFDNHSTVTLEPFFDSTGKPLHDVTVEVAPGRDITSAEFATLFPVTDDPSVLPAAGNGSGSGAQASGANFTSVGIDPLAPSNPIPLLGQEELPSFVINDIPTSGFINDRPKALSNDALIFDEDGLPGGNKGGIGDYDQSGNGPIFATGTLAHDYHRDADGVHESTLLLGTGAPSGFSYKLSDDGLVLTVSQIQNGSSVDVLRITLTDRISGQYTLQQLHAIDHAPGGNENDQVFTFRYRVTDSNGDTADGSLKLTVNDDSPVTAKNESVTFDEDALGGNLGGVGDYHESDNGPITATGTLSHSYGSDGAGTLLLTANGAPEGFHYSVNSSGTVLTVSQMQNGSSVDVIQVSLTDRFSGNYTVKQLHAIQHESGHDENNQDFTFTYVVTDHDSDSVTGTLSLTVNDDTPIIGVGVNQNSEGGRWTLTLDESIGGDRGGNGNGASDDVGSNKTPDPSGTHPIGEVTSRQFDLEDLFTISKSGGADGEKSVTYAYSLSLSGAGENAGVATTLRVTDGAGHYPNDTIYLFKVSDTEIVGRVGNDPNGAIALRITLTDPGDIDNGKIVIDQYMAIDHGSDGNDFDSTQLLKLVGENASLGVTLTGVITDGDNDQATSSATAVLADNQHSRIAIEDDGPSVRVSIDRHFGITIDETPGNQNDDVTGPLHVFDGVANRGDDPHEPGPVLAYARSDGAAATVSAVFGTDGPWHGSVSQATSYGLSVINGTDSGLATTEGREIFLFKEGDLIVGRYDSPTDGNTTVNGNDPAAFAIAIDPNTGVVSMVQYVSIKHPGIFDNDDGVTLNGKTVSVVVTVTDGDGDQASGSADISRAIHFDDDGPKITGRAISETVDEDDIKTPYATGTSPNDGNGDGSYTDSPSDNGSGPADVFGTLAGHVDFGADGPGAYAYRFTSNATSTMAGLHLTSHGQDLHYSVSGDILTAYTTGAAGHTVFTLTVDHTTGNYAFKLYDSLDHVNANGQNTTLETGWWDLGQIDFGSILKATDGDGDSVTLAGQFTITIRDDVPVAHDVTAPKVLDDEAQSLFTPTNSGGNGDVSPNINTFSGGDGSLFAPGADGIRSIAFAPPTGIEAIYKMGNGLAGQEGVHYTTTTSGDHTILTAIGNVSHNVVFTLDVDSDGSYTLKVSEPLVHPTSSTTEENLTIKVGFTVTDSDGDRDSGSLTFKVNDDTPTVDVDRTHDRRGDDVTLGTLTLDESIHQLPGDTNATSDNVSGVTGPAYPFLTAADPSKAIGIVSTPTSGQGTSLAGLFAVDVDFGADGAKAAAVKEYAFTLKNDYGQAVSAGSIHGVETNLVVTALAGTSLAGLSDNARTIYLFKETDGSIVGRIGDNPNGPIALHIAITDSGSGPKMSIEQYLPVEHGNHNSSDESAFLTFDDRDASLGITLTVTATDGDGDVASDSKTVTIADSRNSIIEIQDDGPRITGFSASGTVIQDETPGVTGADPNASNDVASSGLPAGVLTLFDGVANKGVDTDVANAQKEHGAIGFATSQGSIVHVSADFGTDGAAINNSQVLSLAIAGGNGSDSGLQTTDGHRIYLFIENGLIVGRYDGTDPGFGVTNGSYGSSVDPAAFAIALGQDGTISIAQYVSLNNPTPGSSDAAHDEAASGLKNIQATVTLTDGDGDRVSQTINISGNIVFQDDGPSPTVTAPAAINGLDFGTFALNGNAWGTGSGVATGTNGGWTISDANDGHSANPIGNTGGGAVQLERVGDGYQGMHSLTNGYMVDLDASPHDVKISQVVNGLVTGQSYDLRFEAGAPVPNSAHLEVWFGGVKIYDLDPNGQMTVYDIKIKGGFGDGSNLLEFRETGAPDNQGTYLANVSVGLIVIDESAGNQPNTNDVDPNSLFAAVAHKGVDPDMTAGPQFAAGTSAVVSVAANFGADGPWHGSVTEATIFSLSTTSGMDSGLTTTAGQSIHLLNESYGGVGYVVGRFDSNGDQSITSADDAAFAFRIDPTTGVLSLVQYVSLHQPNIHSNNEGVFLNAGALSVSVTITDGDGDTATRSADISANVRFDDDGPHADLVATSTALTIDETAGQDASTDDVADIAAHAALFSSIPGTPIEIAQSQAAVVSATGTIYGADGQGAAPVFALNLSGGNGIDSGLDATDGRSVFLYKEGSLVVGREGTSGGTADSNGKVAFAISLDGSSGVLTVAEYIALYHHNPADPNEAASPLMLADNLIQASVTVTDGDGDTSVASVGIGNQIHFLDDGPSVAPAPLNQIVNGQFVEGVWSDPVWWGSMSTSVDGWAIGPSPTGGYTVDLERSPNGYLGMTTSNGAEMVDMGSSPGNIQITQQFSSLTAGQTYAIQFEAGAPFPKTAELQVLWNGQVIGTIHPSGPGALTSYNYIVTANGTSDALTFREIGTGNAKIDQTWDGHDLMTEDYHGTYLANVGLVATYVVDEDGLAAGNHDLPVPSEGDAPGTATSVTGDLHINWGADNYDSSTADTSDANRFYQDGGTLIGRSVTFTSADIGVSGGLSPTSLTSHGDSVVVTLDDAGTHLVGTAIHDGVSRVVFEASLSDDGTGAFKFTLHDALDHAPNGSENDINITFHFTATDSDGDTATGTFMVGVDDDMPVALGGTINAGAVYEDGLSDGNPETGHTATSVTIHAADLAHLVNFGADGPGGIGFNQAANGTLSGLTSDGSAISYKIVGDTLSGVTADNRTIFTLVDDGAGNFVFTLLDNVDHGGSGDTGTLSLNLASLFTATDADGDSVVLTGGVNVSIENDVPLVATQANLIVNGSFEDGHGLSGGQWSIYHTLDGGWTTGADGVPFEVQVGGPGGVPAQDGSALVELDSDFTGGSLSGDNHVNTTGHTNSTIQQAIAGTEAGQTYEVTFWYAPRPNEGDADSGSMDVLWNGQVVKTIDSTGMTPGVWQQITVFVEGTGPSNTLGFHAIGQENSLGALIDNVSLVAAVVVDEDGLAGPNAFGNHDSHQPGDIDVPNADHDGNEATATGLLNIKWGADSADHGGADSTTGTYGTLAQDHPGGNGNRSVTFDSSPLAAFGGTLTSGHLTSHGEEIQLSFNADRTVLYGTAGTAGVDARTVFEVSLSDDGSGSFRFVLLDQLDHAAGQNENNIALSFNYVATDSDGDHASGSFTVVVNDDVPVAHADTGSVTEGGELVVAAANGVLYNDAFGADGKDAGGGVVGIEAGATAGGTNAQVGSGVHGAHGTLTLGADGHYSYQLDSGVAESLAKGQTLTDVFTYTMSDGDGDTSSATLTLAITGTNHTPEITVMPTDPVGDYNLVDEAGLPTGSNAAALSEYAHGTIHLGDADGLSDIATLTVSLGGSSQQVTINDITGPGTQTFDFTSGDAHGTLVISGYDAGTGAANYTYTLTKPVHDTVPNNDADVVSPGDTFKLTVTDADGATGTANLVIDIRDDVPTARGDTDSVGTGTTTDGNVITGADTTSGALGKDTLGADGAHVSSAYGKDGAGSAKPVGTDTVIDGAYGQLKISSDGHYTYTRTSGSMGGVDDVFNYTLTDGDGDTSPATLTIQIGDSTPTIGSNTPDAGGDTARVFEAGLASTTADRINEPAGSHVGESAYPTTAGGTIAFTSVDGVAGVKLNGTSLSSDSSHPTVIHDGMTGDLSAWYSYNPATGTGTIHYSYTLLDNTLVDPSPRTFSVGVTDADGDAAPAGSLTITIVDDVPHAVADAALTVLETAGATAGVNLLANDARGADGATVTGVNFNDGGGLHAIAASGVTTLTTANGTYTFQADGTWTFDPLVNPANSNTTGNFTYVITDGDGDTSSALQTVNITNANSTPTAGSQSITVDEDGLAGGIAATQPGDVTGAATTVSGTLIHDYNGDGAAASNAISFTSTGAVLDSLGHAVKSGGVALSYFYNASTHTLYGTTNPADATTAAANAAFKVVLTGSDLTTGNYTYTELKPLDHPGHDADGKNNGPETSYEDNLTINIGYQVKDSNGDTAGGTLSVIVNDDSPLATSQTRTVDENATVNTNLLLILDTSGSMGSGYPSGVTNAIKLDVLKAAVNELFEQYGNEGNVAVRIVSFSDNGVTQGNTWLSLADAKIIVKNLVADGSTNYADAINDAMTAFGSAGKLATGTVQNVAYFISDGAPNSGSGVNSSLENDWTDFLKDHDITAYALGIGASVSTGPLDPIAYDGVTETNTSAQVVTDLNQLAQTLVGIATDATGHLVTGGSPAGGFGADGGHLQSITVGGETYTYNPAGSGSISGGTHGSFNTTTHTLTVTLADGGKLSVNMESGAYTYSPPAVINSNFDVPVGFVLVDNDGDTAGNTLTIHVNNADRAPIVRDDHVITNLYGSGVSISIPDYALLFNDKDADGQTIAISGVGSPLGGTVSQGSGVVTFTDEGFSSNGGSFIYTGTAGGKADTGTVTVDRAQADETTLDGTGLGDILLARNSATTLMGYEGNDVLIGGTKSDTLNGGKGADLLVGGGGTDTFIFAAGDSVLTIGGAGTSGTISGYDTIRDFAPGASASASEKIAYSGISVAGNTTANGTDSTLLLHTNAAVASHHIAGGIITFDDVNSFASAVQLTSMSDVAAVTQYLQGVDLGGNGRTVAFEATLGSVTHTFVFIQGSSDANDVLIDLNKVDASSILVSGGQLSVVGTVDADPIVLDLDHNGFSFTPLADGVQFDINHDGAKDQVAWTKGHDGLLALDVNGNGKIDNGSELFTPDFAGGHFADGLAALASLDSNHDGIIDAADHDFAKLLVWQDVNHNGVSDAGELKGLADLGILSIDLATTPGTPIDGQSVPALGTFNYADGSKGSYAEVEFDTSLGEASDDHHGHTQTGTDGVADTFALATTETADTILHYNFAEGDKLDLSALLDTNFGPSSSPSDFVKLTQQGTDVHVQVDTNGPAGGAHFVDVAVLSNYSMSNADIVNAVFAGQEHQLHVTTT